jgi:hypothetical protein
MHLTHLPHDIQNVNLTHITPGENAGLIEMVPAPTTIGVNTAV